MDEEHPRAADCAGGRACSPSGQGALREVRREFVNAMRGVSEAELQFFYLDVFACDAVRFLALYFHNL